MHRSLYPMPATHVFECVCQFYSDRGLCLPSAVKECHPCCATPGHGWWMEPKGGGTLAVCPSLKAIITAMIQAEKNRNSWGTAEETLTDKMQLFLPALFVFNSIMRQILFYYTYILTVTTPRQINQKIITYSKLQKDLLWILDVLNIEILIENTGKLNAILVLTSQ